MLQASIIGVAAVISLAIFGLAIYVLILLYREKGAGHAVLGFFVSPYPYIWGWINAKRLKIVDIMIFWTVFILLAIVFPIILTLTAASRMMATIDQTDFSTVSDTGTVSFTDTQLALGSEDAIPMGSVPMGGRVDSAIDDLFEVHSWTFTGKAGQAVTIQGNAVGGDGTDPRINVLGPDGGLLIGDDDGGQNMNALISSFTLPADGQYTIQVDVWQTGRYEIVLN